MGVDIFLYVEEWIKQLCKNFFFNLFSIYFLTSFHLVGSKSWDSFILLNESANTNFSFFGGGGRGGITQEQEPSWAPDSEEPNYRYPLVSL